LESFCILWRTGRDPSLAGSNPIHLSIPKIHQPIGRYYRRKRFRRFWEAFQLTPQSRVLDIGGYEYYWSLFDRLPRVTIVNVEPPASRSEKFEWVIADARRLPFRDKAFDVAFSNSVIEHVSGPGDREAFSAETVRVGKRYYVQTPSRWFPVEPHLMTPFIHYLPRRVQRKLLRNFTVWGVLVRPTEQGCDDFVRDIRLLTARELRLLFPAAEIWRERTLGIVKSLIAVSPRLPG
jgi:SAM-dependent methyltransferase